MRSRSAALLNELLGLYAKYGPQAFEEATRQLREGEITKLIADALDQLPISAGNLESKQRLRTGSTRKPKHELLLEEVSRLRDAGTWKLRKIAEFAERILSRQILETSSLLREYMSFIGMPITQRQGDRIENIRQIMRYLANLPEHEILNQIQMADDVRPRKSSLQKWADIIVKPDQSR